MIGLTSIIGLSVYMIIVIKRTPVEELKQKHPHIMFMFTDLRKNRLALTFWPVFLFRRLLLALTVTVLKDFQGLQLLSLFCQSSIMIRYLMTHPFESKIENFLLIFNELAV